MDWKRFVASLVSSLAWPVVAVAFLYLLRDQLPDLVKRLKGVSVGSAKAEFVQALEQAKRQAQVLETPDVSKEFPEAPTDKYLRLANEHPEAAVMDCFREVERRLIDIRARLQLPPIMNLSGIVAELVNRGLLDAEAQRLFESLRQARNAAAHADRDHRVTPGEAVDFTYQTWVLTSLLDKILNQLPK